MNRKVVVRPLVDEVVSTAAEGVSMQGDHTNTRNDGSFGSSKSATVPAVGSRVEDNLVTDQSL